MKILAVEHSTDPKYGSNISFFLNAITHNIGRYDMIILPEYAFATKKGLIKEEKKTLVDRIKTASAGKETLVAAGFLWNDGNRLYNSCPLISNGKTLFEYYKETTSELDFEIAEAFGLEYFTGNKQGVFKWKDNIAGLEICRDHGHSRLGRYLRTFSELGRVDIHLVIAKGMSYEPAYDMSSKAFVLCDAGIFSGLSQSLVACQGRLISGANHKLGTSYNLE